ncbi:MAG TPA: hypothetical protein VD997_14780 [Phycisphaerales bacterium]|nr:hypothetical protein [Phycisphaerales bacterium]
MTAASTASPECPRCGYDLTGQVQTWETACPLHGVCSECGLALDFASILDEAHARKWRFFEIAERRLFNAWVVTTRRALRPWVFWSWVRMEHQIKARRAWYGAIVGALSLYMGLGVLIAAVLTLANYLPARLGWMRGFWWRQWVLDQLGSELKQALNPWSEYSYYRHWMGSVIAHSIIALLVLLITPFTFVLLPNTLRAAKVRKRHLVRITAWSIIVPPLLLSLVSGAISLAKTIETWSAGDWAGRVTHFESRFEGRLICVVAIAWVALWWFYACRDYLKLPRALAIAGAMITIATLLAVLITMLIPGADVPLTT